MHMAHMNGGSQVIQLFDMITGNSAKVMKLENYGIYVGGQADLVVLDAGSEEEAIRLGSECLFVIRKGEIVCETQPAKRKLHWRGEASQVDFKV